MKTKKCTKCFKTKPLSDYYRNKRSVDGYRPDCKACEGKPAITTGFDQRFWEKVDKSGNCWNWTAGTNGGGYGRIRKGLRKIAAHRYSWEYHNGKIPHDMHVLHKCDNPSCVNPGHLFLGTNQDNMIDMVKKGRNKPRRGVKNNKAKLNPDSVRKIRGLYATGDYSQYQLADMFGVRQPAIKDVVNNNTWRHVK